MRSNAWMSKLVPALAGLGLALLMIAGVVAQATTVTACFKCRSDWGYWAGQTLVKDGGCKDYYPQPPTQGNNHGTCFTKLIDSKCKAICDSAPTYVEMNPDASCSPFIEDQEAICAAYDPPESANGICSNESNGVNCPNSNSSSTCKTYQVNQGSTKIMGSPCYANCGCKQ